MADKNKKRKVIEEDVEKVKTKKRRKAGATANKKKKTDDAINEGINTQNKDDKESKQNDQASDAIVNNTNEVKAEAKSDPAISLVSILAGDYIAVIGEEKKPWYAIVREVVGNNEQIRVSFLEPIANRRILFSESEAIDEIPYNSLICKISVTAQGGQVVIQDAEQKKATHTWNRIDMYIRNPALEKRERIGSWLFPVQYLREKLTDTDMQKVVFKAMGKDLMFNCFMINLSKYGFFNKQHWQSKSKQGTGSTQFPFLLLIRLFAISLENATWTKGTEPIKWQATFTVPNVGSRQVAICGSISGDTWVSSLNTLCELGFLAPISYYSGDVELTITLPPFQPLTNTPQVVDLTTAMLEEFDVTTN